ncbi:dephospho-CoA kinase [Ideonella paludis]|uniref:Dephospho-CoA kinase n=1 Tax=Ideonella paludis TaxID=1233411 RepID=A0ABS5DWC1_9BURK|nr:dephospho-CoA kinase [Ideonella paludis]MBQ0935443.1 dephospho-CoA kinase [Ideonella paludis]
MPAALRIGLTGGIGSGKSTVAALLAARGALVVDTDAIARSLTAPGGAALPAIAQAFGADAIGADGALDRAKMRERVFGNPVALKQLEAILHPLIQSQAQSQAESARAGQTVVFDVPLLVESGHWLRRVDKVLVVDCSTEEQVRRVMARSGWAEAETLRVIAKQASRQERAAVADAVILNDGISLSTLAQEVDAVWDRWHPPDSAD